MIELDHRLRFLLTAAALRSNIMHRLKKNMYMQKPPPLNYSLTEYNDILPIVYYGVF